MTTFLPYIASVVCALISGLVTYSVAKRQMRAEIQKLEKQHELDLETERQRFEMEKNGIGAKTPNGAPSKRIGKSARCKSAFYNDHRVYEITGSKSANEAGGQYE